MSNWSMFDLEKKIIAILRNVTSDGHHFGRPFISAYQLAIEFREQHPADVQSLNLPIGGVGTGTHTSLSKYLARELSGRIKSGKITCIEGAFLGNLHLQDIFFKDPNRSIPLQSSLTDSDNPLSLFRLKDMQQDVS